MIDLRSDFLASPTAEMMAAMADTLGEDKGYGPREDPRQRALEDHAAALLGTQSALFVPTCSMANLLAVMAIARRGDAVLLDEQGHTFNSESGSLGALAGVMTYPLSSRFGRIPMSLIRSAVRDGGLQQPGTPMIILENTHNKAGGVALESAYFSAVRGVIGARWIHLDGSRLLNAAVALGVPPSRLAGDVDSVSLSLNKGLGAPVGALLAGPDDFIDEATRLRQQVGGGWRPVGMLAAAALVALRTQVDRLADDHRHARLLAETLAESPLIQIDLDTVQTNIVRARLDVARVPAQRLRDELERQGVRIQVASDGAIRMVTHRDVTRSMIEQVRCLLRTALGPGSELIQHPATVSGARP